MAGLALQTVWGYKELRRTLEKDGWKKTDFTVNLSAPTGRANGGGYEDSTLPLINNGAKGDREMIPMNDLGPGEREAQKGRTARGGAEA